MHELFKLIESEAEAVKLYLQFLDSDYAKSSEGKIASDVVKNVIADERDHLNALLIVYQSGTKKKPNTDTQDYVKELVEKQKEKEKLIK